jgi:hypothetical protein
MYFDKENLIYKSVYILIETYQNILKHIKTIFKCITYLYMTHME